MLVYIDDSGDGGYKFHKGSSSHLVMSACVFRDPAEMAVLAQAMANCSARHRRTTEWKYNKSKEDHRTCFFRCTAHVDYRVRAIVIKKDAIKAGIYRTNPQKLKAFAIGQLLSHCFGTVTAAKVFVDGLDGRGFGYPDEQHLLAMANGESPGSVREVRYADSKTNIGLQLADMTAGAIGRAYSTTKQSQVHLNMIRRKARYPEGTLWEFDRRNW